MNETTNDGRVKMGARFAHISDLHFGRSAENDANGVRLCEALLASGIECVVATATSRTVGSRASSFRSRAPSRRCWPTGASSWCPAIMTAWAMTSRRSDVRSARSDDGAAGLYVVRVNSTAPHNRSWLSGHGSLDEDDLGAIDAALDAAPAGHLVIIALHHHVLPMPEEHAMERLSSWLGFVYTSELERGRDLLARVRGRCDLVLHGHRHVPRGARLCGLPRSVHVFNAGSSTELGRVRVFTHDGHGGLLGGRCGWTSRRRGKPRTRRWPAKPACRARPRSSSEARA
jgi:3',5'-cyclic AMP phosphodiesterase CpdA